MVRRIMRWVSVKAWSTVALDSCGSGREYAGCRQLVDAARRKAEPITENLRVVLAELRRMAANTRCGRGESIGRLDDQAGVAVPVLDRYHRAARRDRRRIEQVLRCAHLTPRE